MPVALVRPGRSISNLRFVLFRFAVSLSLPLSVIGSQSSLLPESFILVKLELKCLLIAGPKHKCVSIMYLKVQVICLFYQLIRVDRAYKVKKESLFDLPHVHPNICSHSIVTREICSLKQRFQLL